MSSKVPYLESPTLICLFTMQLYGATMMIKGSLLLSAPVVKRFRSTPPSRSRSLSLHCSDVMLHVYLAQNIISQRHGRWTLQQLSSSSSWVASVVSCLVLYSSEYMIETWHALRCSVSGSQQYQYRTMPRWPECLGAVLVTHSLTHCCA